MPAPPLIPVDDLLQTGQAPLLVGLSGGLDSVVLLHTLASLPEAYGPLFGDSVQRRTADPVAG